VQLGALKSARRRFSVYTPRWLFGLPMEPLARLELPKPGPGIEDRRRIGRFWFASLLAPELA